MEMDRDSVREILDYCPETGVFTWRAKTETENKPDRYLTRWNNTLAGKRAGRIWTDPRTGYQCRDICLFGKHRREHRLAWLWMLGGPVPKVIDHKNRDATDNRWGNIRASDKSDNGKNRSLAINNRSGVTGVTWNNRADKWQAQCTSNGKINYLGLFDEIDEAAMAVLEFRECAGFFSEHGIELPHYHRSKQNEL